MYLFIDTCVFRRLNFLFGKFKLKEIADLAKSGKIQLLMNDVTENEIRKHLVEKVNETKKAIGEFWDGAKLLNAFTEFEAVKKEIKSLRNDLNNRALAEYEKFLEDTSVKVIDFDEVNVTEIFADYFSEKPPFGRKSKKHEFPDAFVIKSLVWWARKHSETIHVISNDPDFEAACEIHDCLKYFENIPIFLEYYTEKDVTEVVIAQAANIYLATENDIMAQIEKTIYNMEAQSNLYFVYDDELSDIEIHNLKVVRKTLTRATESHAEFDLTVNAEITATHTMLNPDTGVPGGPSGDYFYTEGVSFEYTHLEEIQGAVDLSYNPDDSRETPEIEVNLMDEYLKLTIDDFDLSEVKILDSWDNVNI